MVFRDNLWRNKILRTVQFVFKVVVPYIGEVCLQQRCLFFFLFFFQRVKNTRTVIDACGYQVGTHDVPPINAVQYSVVSVVDREEIIHRVSSLSNIWPTFVTHFLAVSPFALGG